jgi:pimeloyl-ACP methyl ester carboxylesterase
MKPNKTALWVVTALILAAGIGFLLRPLSFFDGGLYLRDTLHGVSSRALSVDGYRLHYLDEGPSRGAPVVLIHGLGASAEDWRHLAPFLAKAGFHVFLPDLPGYGRSQRPANFSYSVRDEAAIVVGFLDALGLKQVDLGGWSMGGWIVQIVAGQAPQRIRRLMLFDSAGLNVAPGWDTRLFTPTTAEQLAELEALLTPHHEAIPGFIGRDILRISRQRAWIIDRAMASMLAGRDVTNSLLPTLEMPVLILWGAQDQIVPVNQAETMHRLITHSELVIVPGCGHLAPLECAAKMGPKVVAFLKQ